MKPIVVAKPVRKVTATADGSLSLLPKDAELNGDGIQIESKGDIPDIGYWDSPNDTVSWTINVPAAGRYAVSVSMATINDGAEFVVESANQSLTGSVPNTGAWDQFKDVELGTLTFEEPGEYKLTFRPRDAQHWKPINLHQVLLQK